MARVWFVMRVVVASAVGALVAVTAVLYALQDRLVFPAPGGIPREAIDQVAAEVGAQPIDLRASDGTPLYAWLLPAHRPPGATTKVVIAFHGNATVVSDPLPTYRVFLARGYDVLALSYRGYPGSGGEPSEPGLLLDAEAAWAWARDRYPADRIVLYGRSLGGGVAAGLAAGPANPAAMVLESTFSSIREIAERQYPPLAPLVPWLLRSPFDSRARGPEFGVPVFLVHSRDDRTIPIDLGGRRLREVIADVEYREVDGYGHNSVGIVVVDPGVKSALEAFLDRAVPDPP